MAEGARPAAPYGSWPSPISAALVAAGGLPLSSPRFHDGGLYWLEGKPEEGGRLALRRAAAAAPEDVLPAEFNVRTRVHEYGGGAYVLHGAAVTFSHFADQRLYRYSPGSAPRPITPAPPAPGSLRYADACVTPDGRWLVCVRESHDEDSGREPINELVVLPADGSASPRSLASGADFYASPRLSPDGRQLLWLQWRHPNMPWDETELWVAELSAEGALAAARRLVGGSGESVFQPEWSPRGEVHFVSDRSGWWNLYRLDGGQPVALAPVEAECGVPRWVFGLSTYALLAGGRLACLYSSRGVDRVGIVEPGSGRIEPLDVPDCAFTHAYLVSDGANRLAYIGASSTEPPALVTFDLASGRREVVRRSVEAALDPRYVSEARPTSFPGSGGTTAHGYLYLPRNDDVRALEGERPPLRVLGHGGPTSRVTPGLDLEVQFWTSRGFAVVAVNHGGSAGYGRAYRDRLKGQWGIVDVEDCIAAARYLVDSGTVDGDRLIIRGGSAGGYTTLCALTFHQVFQAGASYYGVGDLEVLARHTHKFEARYLDALVGPYPECQALYQARSPIHFTDRLSSPLILFQGLDDRVVPPEQAEQMARALEARGLPYAYVTFPGEGHGFRRADTLRRALEAELWFYSRVFGFPMVDQVEPVEIRNLQAHA